MSVFIILLSACANKLEIAGQQHALVFKKWQTLADYAGNTFSQSPIILVADLVGTNSPTEPTFSLVNFRLTDKESPYQINLRNPTFEKKYICSNECIYLTEYLNLDAKNSTVLARYFDEYEFNLFKFYGVIFSLHESIDMMKKVSEARLDDYLTWLVKQNATFSNFDDFSNYLQNSFSLESYTLFLRDPAAIYSLGVNENSSLDVSEVSTWMNLQSSNREALNWDLAKNASPSETLNWSTNEETPPTEILNWDSTTLINYSIYQGGESSISFNIQQQLEPEVGDLICNLANNTFGQAIEVRGNVLTLSMVGLVELIVDGIKNKELIPNSFESTYPKYFSKHEGIFSFAIDELSVCELDFSKLQQ